MATEYVRTTGWLAEGPGGVTGYFRRISWGAIFAGAIVALVLQIMLNLLGMGIGLGVVNPATDPDAFEGIGAGAGIWMGITSLISLFAGGWVAGRLAGFPRTTGALHGVVMWGMVTLFSLYFITTAAGALVSGVTGVVGRGMTALSASPQAARQMEQAVQQPGGAVQGAISEAERAAEQAQTPQGRQRIEEIMGTLSSVSIWAFFGLLLGAVAAGIGGSLGAPKALLPPAEETRREEMPRAA